MPQEIINKSYIMAQFYGQLSKQFLNIIGISDSQIVYHYNQWCFAKNLYVITSDEPFLGHSVYGVPLLAKILTEKFHLDEIKANKHCLMNREKNKERYITNFNDLYKEICKTLPQYKWIIFDSISKNMKKTIKQWASVKIMVCHSGSGPFNIPFMKKNSGLCIIMPNSIEYGVGANAASLGIWVIGVSHAHALSEYDVIANIPWVITCLQRLCYAVEHGSWPNDMQILGNKNVNSSIWEPFWNLTKTRQKFGVTECSF